MKKVILIVMLICMTLAMSVGLTACNNATPQGQLADILKDQKHERFVYDVLNKYDKSTGTYVVTLDAYSEGSNIDNFGSAKLKSVGKGILVKGMLTFGATTYEMGCYYTLVDGASFMVPAYSYRIQKENGKTTFSVQGSYSGNNYNFDRDVNGKKSSGVVNAKGTTVFDNNQFQQVLRSMTTFSTGSSLTFVTPLVSATEDTPVTLTASVSSVENVKTPYTKSVEKLAKDGISCYAVSVSRSTEVAGMSQTLYYAVDDINYNGWKLKNVLVKIVEPFKVNGEKSEMQYTLKSISIA